MEYSRLQKELGMSTWPVIPDTDFEIYFKSKVQLSSVKAG